jgi:hypothetical protein
MNRNVRVFCKSMISNKFGLNLETVFYYIMILCIGIIGRYIGRGLYKEPSLKGRLSTVDLLVQTSLNQVVLIVLKIIYFFIKQVR